MRKERWKAGLDQGGENTVVPVCLTNLATVDTTLQDDDILVRYVGYIAVGIAIRPQLCPCLIVPKNVVFSDTRFMELPAGFLGSSSSTQYIKCYE